MTLLSEWWWRPFVKCQFEGCRQGSRSISKGQACVEWCHVPQPLNCLVAAGVRTSCPRCPLLLRGYSGRRSRPVCASGHAHPPRLRPLSQLRFPGSPDLCMWWQVSPLRQSQIAATLGNNKPSECLKSFLFNILNPALQSFKMKKILWPHQYFNHSSS